ncbi:GH36-type glycosyl hydrolase domain-containing protein [Mucisphaera calidilacus]|uniref:N,N'-diacetylchitobiose phosphorylase n=1 Tax=Mucisphaera calidilacus TaxID=2527982 RepID=A0A518BUR5_9BACT|nr:hypothetical protein [Mucisphaera calidilacus]QDU70687.1 N,N'-diacetylchitobiose phosphorylase [Mucisphaera calidilacus]
MTSDPSIANTASDTNASPALRPRQVRSLLDESGMTLLRLNNDAGLCVTFHPNGVLHAITHDNILINHAIGDPLRGTTGRLYLRRHYDQSVNAIGLNTPDANSAFGLSESAAAWSGTWDDIRYRCTLMLHPNQPAWCWRIDVHTEHPATLDAILVQDLGLSTRAGVLINEAYNAQYLDQRIEQAQHWGPVALTRQNRPVDGRFPWLAQACVTGGEGCLTDGVCFFGPGHRSTGQPERLRSRRIGIGVHQGEFAATTLQSIPITCTANEHHAWTFAAVFQPDHPEASDHHDLKTLTPLFDWAAHAREQARAETARVDRHRLERLPRLAGERMKKKTLRKHFPAPWRHKEKTNGETLSFFRGTDEHVITALKEAATERPHGHILRAADNLLPADNDISSTIWMHGVFASQITLGNTVLQKILPVTRNPSDVASRGGLRILVRLESGWHQLGVPSAMSLTRDAATWLYQHDDTTLKIHCRTESQPPALNLSIDIDGPPLRLILVSDVALGAVEFGQAGTVEIDPDQGSLTLRPSAASEFGQHEPDAWFALAAEDPEQLEALGGDELLFADGRARGYPWVAMQTKPVDRFTLRMTGGLDDTDTPSRSTTTGDTQTDWLQLDAGLRLEHDDPHVSRIEDTLRWFGHNALIHLASPHGLEQFNGGAWGVRDVCQGPVEFLLAKGQAQPVRDILVRLFAEQNEAGDWPQWFMFDGYTGIRQADSHGDVVVWPLKALATYLLATGDRSLLKESLPYYATDARATILEHALHAVSFIEKSFVPGTRLMRYGHGDWNDALQPTSQPLRERLVSTWTCELLSQTLRELGTALHACGADQSASRRLRQRAADVRDDVRKHLMPDGVICGMGYHRENNNAFEPILHPQDVRTGLRYRLLPMTRGILSGLFTAQEAHTHLRLIRSHLLAPDGARLMDRPTAYLGGIERFFQRAESAAAFSREIGLMYVHAHLRYAEALACLGEADALVDALLCATPVKLDDHVHHAQRRQANAYFSSSDADVANRDEATRRYEDVMTGNIPVKGGWRIYSSGPGIYVSAVIRSLLGWRETADAIVIDPVLPQRLDGLAYTFDRGRATIRCTYHINDRGHGPARININGKPVGGLRREPNPYREGGLILPASSLPQKGKADLEVIL